MNSFSDYLQQARILGRIECTLGFQWNPKKYLEPYLQEEYTRGYNEKQEEIHLFFNGENKSCRHKHRLN